MSVVAGEPAPLTPDSGDLHAVNESCDPFHGLCLTCGLNEAFYSLFKREMK